MTEYKLKVKKREEDENNKENGKGKSVLSIEVQISDKKALMSAEEEYKISQFGVNYIEWDFGNFEAKEIRYLADPSKFGNLVDYKKYPKYLNKVDNYKFKYTYVNIQFNTQKTSGATGKFTYL